MESVIAACITGVVTLTKQMYDRRHASHADLALIVSCWRFVVVP